MHRAGSGLGLQRLFLKNMPLRSGEIAGTYSAKIWWCLPSPKQVVTMGLLMHINQLL